MFFTETQYMCTMNCDPYCVSKQLDVVSNQNSVKAMLRVVNRINMVDL